MSQPPHEPPSGPPPSDPPPPEPQGGWEATAARPPQPPSGGWPSSPPPPTQPFPPASTGPSAYANQPGQGGEGYGAPPGQMPPHPPSSGGSKTGLIIGLVAAGVLVLAAVVVGVVLLVSGDDEEPVAGGSSESSSAEPSDDSTTEPTDEPSEEPTATPDGDRLRGQGYSYELLDGWNDISADVLAGNPPGAIDTVSSWGRSIQKGRANLIVERQSAGTDDPEDLRESWEANLGTAVGVKPQRGSDQEIDGETALSATLDSVNAQDVSVSQTALLTVVDGAVYSITLSAEDGDADAQDAFEEILDSWAWE